MGHTEKLTVEQGFLDAYFAMAQDELDPEFLALFDKPEKHGEGDVVLSRPEALRKALVASDPMKVISHVASRSRERNLMRKMKGYGLVAAGLRIWSSRDWPFRVAHVWFQIGIKEPEADRPQRIQEYILVGVQDIFYGLEEAVGKQADRISAAVFSIVAAAEPSLFAKIRGAWKSAARTVEETPKAGSDLWSVLPENWKIGDYLTVSHMAMGINLHTILGSMHHTEDMRQMFSITVQNESLKSYGDSRISPSYGGWGGSMKFLSPRRGAYYGPRSQELGMLMLLGNWTKRLMDAADNLEAGKVEPSLARNDPHFWRSPDWYLREPVRLRNLHREVKKELMVIRKSARPMTFLRQIVEDRSVYSGIEVPAYLYPAARYGSQESSQEGLVEGMAGKIHHRVRDLVDTLSLVAAMVTDEVIADNSVRQSMVSIVLMILTFAILALTVVVAFR